MARPSGWAAGPAALVLLVCALTAANAAERISDNIFLVRDKPGTPMQFNMIVHAGCYNEVGGHCRGLSHYLEHLVLTGRNPEHKEAGVRLIPDGDMNGITSQRFTRYFYTAPARVDGPRADLELLFNFYAARLRDFAITPEDALRERNVVRQEYDWRTGSQARVRFAQKLNNALIPDHPAGSFGTADDIEAYTVDDARAFHRQWYMPSNATFVIKATSQETCRDGAVRPCDRSAHASRSRCGDAVPISLALPGSISAPDKTCRSAITDIAVADFRLLGAWVVDCNQIPTPRNEHATFSKTAAGDIQLVNDFRGGDYDNMVYRITLRSAHPTKVFR